ncbi:MAG: hypothetical protein ACO1PW_14585, partial [Actinomycetota bacterium]
MKGATYRAWAARVLHEAFEALVLAPQTVPVGEGQVVALGQPLLPLRLEDRLQPPASVVVGRQGGPAAGLGLQGVGSQLLERVGSVPPQRCLGHRQLAGRRLVGLLGGLLGLRQLLVGLDRASRRQRGLRLGQRLALHVDLGPQPDARHLDVAHRHLLRGDLVVGRGHRRPGRVQDGLGLGRLGLGEVERGRHRRIGRAFGPVGGQLGRQLRHLVGEVVRREVTEVLGDALLGVVAHAERLGPLLGGG